MLADVFQCMQQIDPRTLDRGGMGKTLGFECFAMLSFADIA